MRLNGLLFVATFALLWGCSSQPPPAGGTNGAASSIGSGSQGTSSGPGSTSTATSSTSRGGASSGGSSSSSGGSSGATSSSSTAASGGSSSGGATDGGLFDGCSIDGGCSADCSPPAVDPLATGNSSFDLYDGCLLAGMQVAGMTEAWQGQLLKSQMYEESGITPLITTSTSMCGGENCGPWAISAGSVSGDSPPGPCGSSQTDPFTGQVDYSHSYGLFQSTPACDGVFALTTSLYGDACTATTEADVIPFGPSIDFYCESATSLTGGYIDAVQDTSSPLYAKSAFNPAYQIYVYFAQWSANFQQANAGVSGCTTIREWYLTLAYWLTGNATTSCTLTGPGYDYVQAAIQAYQSPLYGSAWPYPFP